MANAHFCHVNQMLGGTLTASAETPELPAINLRTPSGSPSMAWQTPDGVVSATLRLDAGASVSWRDFILARTNLTSAATVRWRVGESLSMLEGPLTYSTDSNVSAVRAANITRVGSTVMDQGSMATVYESSSSSSSNVAVATPLSPGRYNITVRLQRITGTGTTGNALVVRYYVGSGLTSTSFPMNQLAQTGSTLFSFNFNNDLAATVNMLVFSGTGSVGQVAVGSMILTPLPAIDSGLRPGPASGFQQSVYVAPAQVTGRYLRCDIADPANPDNFLNIPLAGAFPAWELGINLSPQSALSPTRERDVKTTRSGSQIVRPLFYRNGWALSHDGVTKDELFPRLNELDRASWGGRNILFVPDPDSANVNSEAVFGLLSVTSDVTFPYNTTERRAWRGRIDERL